MRLCDNKYMIFDGKKFARELEDQIKNRVQNLAIKPHIVSIVVGDDPASALYTRLKKAAAERVGIEFEIAKIVDRRSSIVEFAREIAEIGERKEVTGVMVQLPLPGVSRKDTAEVLQGILLAKDVDGLRWEESGVMPATVRAVMAILDNIAKSQIKNSLPTVSSTQSLQAGQILKSGKYVVIGSRGAVGRPLVHFLKERGIEVSEVEWDTPDPARTVLAGDIVISCVGKAGVVSGDMVSDGVIAIDVGMSAVNGKVAGDMSQEVYQKASISVQVPGGVGPVTIASLLQNSLELSERL